MKNLNVINDPDIKMILQMPCKFEEYEVSYDNEDEAKYFQRRAQLCGVKVSPQPTPYQSDYETCEGTVENCIRYLYNYIKDDYGYQAGSCFMIDNVKPSDQKFVAAFKKFIDWLSTGKHFTDFKLGVAEGGEMRSFMK